LLSISPVAVGTFTLGAVAIGIFTLGAVSIGMYSNGAVSIATHVAIGDHAYGHIAIGRVVSGTREFIDTSPRLNLSAISRVEVRQAILEEFPGTWNWVINWMTMFLGR
jgi:hypothetical protein